MNVSQLRNLASTIPTEDALKKALELLDEVNTALGAIGDRRYAFMRTGDLVARPTTTRHLSYRIESFTDVIRTFVLKEDTNAKQKTVA